MYRSWQNGDCDSPVLVPLSALPGATRILPLRWPDAINEPGLANPDQRAHELLKFCAGKHSDLSVRHPRTEVADAIKTLAAHLEWDPVGLLSAVLGSGLRVPASFEQTAQFFYAQTEQQAEDDAKFAPTLYEKIGGADWLAIPCAMWRADGPQPTHRFDTDQFPSGIPDRTQIADQLVSAKMAPKTPTMLPDYRPPMTGRERVYLGDAGNLVVASRFLPLLEGRSLFVMRMGNVARAVVAVANDEVVAIVSEVRCE